MSVKSPTTSRKLGWCSDNLLSSGDFDTELQMLHIQQDANLWPAPNIESKTRVCKKVQRWPRRVLELCLWTDETKMNLYLSDGKAKMTANDPKHTASSVKHGGGGFMAWACMAVSGTGPLKFNDDLMSDSSRINLEGYKTILPTNIQENTTRLIGKCFILHQDNDPKHPASSVKEFIRADKWKVDCPSQSPDLNLIEH